MYKIKFGDDSKIYHWLDAYIEDGGPRAFKPISNPELKISSLTIIDASVTGVSDGDRPMSHDFVVMTY